MYWLQYDIMIIQMYVCDLYFYASKYSIFHQITDSYKTFECVQKDEAPSVIPVAFYAYISRTFKALSPYKPFIFDALEMDTIEKLAFSLHHPVVCMHFLGPFTPPVHITLALVVVNLERWRRCWHKMESQKGRSMQIQKNNMMTLQPQGLWFCLLRRETSFKSYVQWPARVLFSALNTMGEHLFQDIALCNIYLKNNGIWYK